MTALLTAAPTVIPPAAGTSSATDKAVVAAILLTVGLGLAVALGLVCVHVLKHRLSPQKQINDLESSIPSTFAKPSIEDLQNPARYQHRDPNIGQARLNKAHEDNSCTQSSEYQEEFFTDDSKSPTATIFRKSEATNLLKQRCCQGCVNNEGHIGLGIYLRYQC